MIEGYRSYFYSQSGGEDREKAEKKIIEIATHPDKGSDFERTTRSINPLLKKIEPYKIAYALGCKILHQFGYDLLAVRPEEEIMAHTAFQVHKDNTLHVFAVNVNEPYRGQGIARKMQEDILAEARRREIKRVRIGGGSEESMSRIIRRLEEDQTLRVTYTGENWLRLD